MDWRGSLGDIKAKIEAVVEFVHKLSRLGSDIGAFVEALHEWVGLATLLLLLFVLLLAPLWGLLGVPKGRLQFFIALLSANLILFWLGVRLEFWSAIQGGVLRGNAILLLPFVLIWLAPFARKGARKLGRRFHRRRSESIWTPHEVAQAWDGVRLSFAQLDEAFYQELLAAKGPKERAYYPSPELQQAWRDLRKRQRELEADFFAGAGQD